MVIAVVAVLAAAGVVAYKFVSTGGRTSNSAAHSSAPTGSPNAGGSASSPSASSGSGDPGPGQYKIIINGQDITVGTADEGGGDIGCLHTGTDNNQIDIRVEAARDMQDAYVTNTDPPQVVRVALADANTGMEYLFDPTQNQSQHIGGDAKVTKSGNTYKVTGHISPYLNGMSHVYDAAPVPFEYDATCP